MYPLNLTLLDLASRTLTNLPVFDGANNLNAQFSGNSKRIFFLSNRDGFRNLYEYNLENKRLKQLTDYFTGISGIMEFCPALTVSRDADIIYDYYRSQRYTLYNAALRNFKTTAVDRADANLDAAILPPVENSCVNIVNLNLQKFNKFERVISDSLRLIPYKPKFKLDYLANGGVGVSTSRFGTGVQGGIVRMFSNILGENQIVANVSVNGEVYDFGGLVGYGDYKFVVVNVDVRKYVRTKPFTFAARALSYIRLGIDGESLYPLYLGYPYLIRDYEANSFYNNRTKTGGTFDINQLSGSKVTVLNF